MAEPVAFKYRAFISYSHADTSWAKWLHRGVEGFRIDKDLVGRKTERGAVPKSLRPVFRDRDDFTAGHTLTEQTLAALDASEALIVICSPAAAKSHYVNEEIRLFKSRHPKRPVIPLIVAGTPGDAELECFPQALKFKVDGKGRIGKKRLELLAADAREEGDGKPLALAKVIAGLLDVTSDEVFRRAERERRGKARVRNGVIGVLAFLSVAAMGSAAYAWQQLKTNEAFLYATLKTATEFVDEAVAQAERFGVPRTATLSLLTKAEGLFDNMAMLGKPTPELRYQKAWMLIQFANNYQALGDTTKWHERAETARQMLPTLFDEQPGNRLIVASSPSPTARSAMCSRPRRSRRGLAKLWHVALARLAARQCRSRQWWSFARRRRRGREGRRHPASARQACRCSEIIPAERGARRDPGARRSEGC